MSYLSLPAGTRVYHKDFGEGIIAGNYDRFLDAKGQVLVDWDGASGPQIMSLSSLLILLTYGP